MNIIKENVLNALKDAIAKSVREMDGKKPKVRKFDESIELIFNMRDVNFQVQTNRITLEHILPNPVRKPKELKAAFFVTGDLEVAAKKLGYVTVNKDQLNEWNKKTKAEKRKFVKTYDYFSAESTAMMPIAKTFGRFLQQNGKTINPRPIGYGILRATENLTEYVGMFEKIVRLKMTKSPLLQTAVGKKSMKIESVLENILSVVARIESSLPNGTNNIRSLYLKTTMGPAIRVKEPEKTRGRA